MLRRSGCAPWLAASGFALTLLGNGAYAGDIGVSVFPRADLGATAFPGDPRSRPSSSGSGFYIAKDRVLTNSHVVRQCPIITVGNNSDGQEVPGFVIADDPRVDLAVLRADGKDVVSPAAFVAAPLGETRDDLAFAGYPEHGLPVLQAEFGKALVFEYDLKTGGNNFTFHGAVRRGNSGGPLLSVQGAVVGVVTAKINTPEVYRQTGQVVDDVAFAISSTTVLEFLKAHHIGFEAEKNQDKLTPQDLERKVHGFVRQIRCWK